MASVCRPVSFAAATSTGNQEVDTGFGAEIKALILFWTNQASAGFAAGESGGLAFITASVQKCLTWAGDDNVATTNTGGGYTNDAVRVLSAGTPTTDAIASFVSFGTGADAGKFTINWSDAPAAAVLIRGLAIGGADVSGAVLLEKSAPTATGNRDDTGFGSGGKVVFFMGRGAITAVGTGATSRIGVGAAVSASVRGAMRTGDRDNRSGASTNHPEHHIDNAACFLMAGTNADQNFQRAVFVDWTSDGYTLNWTLVQATAHLYCALVLKGANLNVDIDELSAPASTGTQAITTGFDMADGGIFVFGTGQATANATDGAEHHICLGAAGGASPSDTGKAINTSGDDVINSDNNSRSTGTHCVSVFTNPSTVAAEAQLVAAGTTTYTLDWTTTASGRKWFAVALAGTPATASIPRVMTAPLVAA